MLTGKTFKLFRTAPGLEIVNQTRHFIRVPAGEILRVVGGQDSDDERMIDVRWKDRTVEMFAEDVQSSGKEVVQ